MEVTTYSWDDFCEWINTNNVIKTNKTAYFSGFQKYFDTLMGKDISDVYITWQSYMKNTGQEDTGRSFISTMYKHYLRFLLEKANQKLDISIENIPLLKQLFSQEKKGCPPLNTILNCAINLPNGKEYTFTKSQSFITKGGRISDLGYHYYVHRYVFSEYRNNSEQWSKCVNNVADYFAEKYPNPKYLCASGAKMAQALDNLWKDTQGYMGSGTQQKLLQLISLQEKNYDLFKNNTDICKYFAGLLLDLFANLFASDGTDFGKVSISSGTLNYWPSVLALAPFQRLDLTVDFAFRPGSTHFSNREISLPIMQLIKMGLLWLDYPPRAITPVIKIIPCSYRILEDKEIDKPDSIWKRDDDTNQFRSLLIKLCQSTLTMQKAALSSSTCSPSHELLTPKPELALLLSCAPSFGSSNYSALKLAIINLLQVQVNCYAAQTASSDFWTSVEGYKRICDLAAKWPDLFSGNIYLPSLSSLENRFSHTTIYGRLAQLQSDKILNEITENSYTPHQIFKYAIFVECYARKSMDVAYRERNIYAFIHSGHTLIKALLLQGKHAPQKDISGTSLLTDYIFPCCKTLYLCNKELILTRSFSSLRNPTNLDSAQTEFQNAVLFYNQFCANHAFENKALLFPSNQNTVEELDTNKQCFDSYANSITCTFFPSPETMPSSEDSKSMEV